MLLQIFGTIDTPPGVKEYGELELSEGAGLVSFIKNIIRFIRILAGIYALFNLILAGMQYISAGGDPKKTAEAWQKIYMSGIGLLIIVSSFVIAAILGFILFGDPLKILAPTIYGPGA